MHPVLGKAVRYSELHADTHFFISHPQLTRGSVTSNVFLFYFIFKSFFRNLFPQLPKSTPSFVPSRALHLSLSSGFTNDFSWGIELWPSPSSSYFVSLHLYLLSLSQIAPSQSPHSLGIKADVPQGKTKVETLSLHLFYQKVTLWCSPLSSFYRRPKLCVSCSFFLLYSGSFESNLHRLSNY